jgi:hypothetical protein
VVLITHPVRSCWPQARSTSSLVQIMFASAPGRRKGWLRRKGESITASGSTFSRWNLASGRALLKATDWRRENTPWRCKRSMQKGGGENSGSASWLILPGDTPPSRWYAQS